MGLVHQSGQAPNQEGGYQSKDRAYGSNGYRRGSAGSVALRSRGGLTGARGLRGPRRAGHSGIGDQTARLVERKRLVPKNIRLAHERRFALLQEREVLPGGVAVDRGDGGDVGVQLLDVRGLAAGGRVERHGEVERVLDGGAVAGGLVPCGGGWVDVGFDACVCL